LRKQLFTKLKGLEKKQGLRLDWKKIETVLIEARGIPVPILENTGTMADLMKHAVTLHTPAELYGRPKTPPGDANSWYVRALETKVESTAKRAAAMLNHLGPQIPAHVVPAAGGRYQVMAGPFKDAKSSKAAAQRMMVDLEMRGKIVPPNELTLR
jgi:L,D-transpeptidase ErfK/SrfK